jgi:hypothetical protein
MKSVTDVATRSLILFVAIGLLLFLFYQPALATTDYVFFSVNGDTSANSIVQGDNVSWGANCATGAQVTWEIWVDLNQNYVIDSGSDLMIATFDCTDGDTSAGGPPPDINPIPDGWFITPPMILGVAPAQYIFKATDHTDNSSAQRWISCSPLVSPPNMFRGQVSLEGHPAPDSAYLRNIWIESSPDENGSQIWSGLTNDSGFFQINVGAAGSGLLFDIYVPDIPGFITPGDQYRTASGVVDDVNFTYMAPADSMYGLIKDQRDSLITAHVYIHCSPEFSGPSQKDAETTDGTYRIYFGSSEYGRWNAGLDPANLVPDHLCPSNFEFDNSVTHSFRYDFTCYTTDTVIYARVTEQGHDPVHSYIINCQSTFLQSGTYGISGIGAANLVTLYISSLDSAGWNLNVADWDDNYPIPPGYILEGEDQFWNRHPGDTVSLNFITGRMVRDAFAIDPGDPPPNWDNVWVSLSNDQANYGGNADTNGTYTIYADTGVYEMRIFTPGYLNDPPMRDLHLTADTSGGLGFMLNETHCRVSGSLVNVPTPLPNSVFVYAHTADQYSGYSTGSLVDSLTGGFALLLCDGNWTIDPPSIPDMITPPQLHLNISERPDTSRSINLIYEPMSVGDGGGSLPKAFTLNQNYPNPFNARTIIQYSLPQDAHVNIEIYDLLGREVETVLDGDQQAGYYQVTWNASYRPSGIYFYRIKADDFTEMKKMLLLK